MDEIIINILHAVDKTLDENQKILDQINSGTYRTTITDECSECGEDTLTTDGEFATGVLLPSGYQPLKGELIKIYHIKCPCGVEQWG